MLAPAIAYFVSPELSTTGTALVGGSIFAATLVGRPLGSLISVATRCDECILYHLDGCEREGASREETVEAIKIGLMAGGSIAMPNARFAFEALAKVGKASR
jgi:AhpD family alkylhydroperoxidase